MAVDILSFPVFGTRGAPRPARAAVGIREHMAGSPGFNNLTSWQFAGARSPDVFLPLCRALADAHKRIGQKGVSDGR